MVDPARGPEGLPARPLPAHRLPRGSPRREGQDVDRDPRDRRGARRQDRRRDRAPPARGRDRVSARRRARAAGRPTSASWSSATCSGSATSPRPRGGDPDRPRDPGDLGRHARRAAHRGRSAAARARRPQRSPRSSAEDEAEPGGEADRGSTGAATPRASAPDGLARRRPGQSRARLRADAAQRRPAWPWTCWPRPTCARLKKARFLPAEAAEIRIGASQVWLVDVDAVHERVGSGLRELRDQARVEPEHVIAVHDELEIPAGELMLKFGGGSGGHNGLKSLTQALGTPVVPPRPHRDRASARPAGSRRLRPAAARQGRRESTSRSPSAGPPTLSKPWSARVSRPRSSDSTAAPRPR